MKHILILTLLLPVICLGQKKKSLTRYQEDAINGRHYVTPQVGDTWRTGDTIYTVNRNNEVEKYVRLKDSCSHIWVEEYARRQLPTLEAIGRICLDCDYSDHVVCVKCFKRETRKPLTPTPH